MPRPFLLALALLLVPALPAAANRLTAAEITLEVTSLARPGNWRRVQMAGGTLRILRVDDGQTLAETLPATEDHLRLLAAAAASAGEPDAAAAGAPPAPPAPGAGEVVVRWRIRDGAEGQAGSARHDWRSLPPAVETAMATLFGAEDWRP